MSRLLSKLIVVSLLVSLASCHAVDSSSTVKTPKTQTIDTSLEAEPAYELATLVRLEKRQPLESEGLHNVYVLSENISSGSEPEGEEAFARLQEMGIKTILSVDGKLPEEALAKAHGMRYVHIPIQYKGIEDKALLHIAKTFRELEGPFYVHCFHGRHRGPAAAAVGRIVLDGASRKKALAEMRQWFGTSSKYEGLYQLIAHGALPSESLTQEASWDFPAAHRVEGIASSMVSISRAEDALKTSAKLNWGIDPGHPDFNAVNEANILLESFERMSALSAVSQGPPSLRANAKASIFATQQLKDQLSRFAQGDAAAGQLALGSMKTIKRLCSSCHRAHRNH